METITNEKMIESLRLKEAKMWENYLDVQKQLTAIYGIDFENADLSIEETRVLQRHTSKWMCINEILAELEITAYNYSERDELKKQGKL
jgi:hypothetical protein